MILVMKDKKLVSSYNLALDNYIGQYGLFYDFYFKPSIVLEKVTSHN